MGGGLIQLSSVGSHNIFISENPQVTFFKSVYKQHTKFSIDTIPLDFNDDPEYGKNARARINRSGDLLHQVILEITFPSITSNGTINEQGDPNTIRWSKYLGYSVLDYVEIEIGGKVVDRHSGEFMCIQEQLQDRLNKEMVGHLSELYNTQNTTNYTSKDYTFYIPLQFWFCKKSQLALPLISLMYHDVIIIAQFALKDKVCHYGPSFVMRIPTVTGSITNIPVGTVITDNNGNWIGYIEVEWNSGDNIYYHALNELNTFYIDNNIFTANTSQIIQCNIQQSNIYITNTTGITGTILDASNNTLGTINRAFIYNSNVKIEFATDYEISQINVTINSQIYKLINIKNVNSTVNKNLLEIPDITAKLLANYIYLSDGERNKFVNNSHEYLIEQIQYHNPKHILHSIQQMNIPFLHPVKELIWFAKTDYAKTIFHDEWNYSNDPENKNTSLERTTIYFNGYERISNSKKYFEEIQIKENHKNIPLNGISIYSFSLYPEQIEPSGSANFSVLDSSFLLTQYNWDTKWGTSKKKLYVYAINYNVFVVNGGMGGMKFHA